MRRARMRPAVFACGIAAALVGAGAGHAQSGEIALETYSLANGLTVILAPNPAATTVAVNVWYDAGSRREPRGRSGFAHLFEHLMFQGSENVEPGAHSRLVSQAGGVNNAYLLIDNTSFFQTLPPDRYNLGLWLEADRMRSLRITEENLRREIEVVKEERRLSYENSPYGMSRLDAWFYLPFDDTTCFSYAHSQIGSREDLDAATLADVTDFFETYYVPNNATLTIAGAFDSGEARALVDRYFGDIPRSAEPPAVACSDPFRNLPIRKTVEDANATLPGVMHSYGTVPASHADAEAINLLVSILAEGESSRFNRRLVREEQAALEATAFNWERLGPGIAWVFAVANQGVAIERVETLIDEVLADVRRNGVTQAELEKARNNHLANTIREQETSEGVAETVQYANLYLGDPHEAAARLERVRRVTVADIQRVANAYFTPDNRAVIVTTPAATGGNR